MFHFKCGSPKGYPLLKKSSLNWARTWTLIPQGTDRWNVTGVENCLSRKQNWPVQEQFTRNDNEYAKLKSLWRTCSLWTARPSSSSPNRKAQTQNSKTCLWTAKGREEKGAAIICHLQFASSVTHSLMGLNAYVMLRHFHCLWELEMI